MLIKWKKQDERRNILIFCLIVIILCTNVITLLMMFRLPFPKELKQNESHNIISNQINKFSLIIPDSNFISEIRNITTHQYQYYRDKCKDSDILRPLTGVCRNFTQSSETTLSYLAVSQLLKQNDEIIQNNEFLEEAKKKLKSLTIKKNIGIEIGRVSDFVIAPLISAFFITRKHFYLERAISLSKELLKFITRDKPIPAPFIGYDKHQQHFGQTEVFIDDVSSIFPVLASIAYITQDSYFFDPVQNFVTHIRNSIFNQKIMKSKKKDHQYSYSNYSKNEFDLLIPIKFSLENDQIGISNSKYDFPYRLFADLNRISKILPSIKTNDIIQVGINRLNKENPTVVYDENYVKIISIEPCWFSSVLQKNDPMYSLIVKKCKSLIKRKPTPSRMNGNCEFGGYNLLTQFEFDGEILEILWKNENINEAKKLISNAIKDCNNDGFITGLRNTTFEGKRSDNFLHPQFFSRWALNAVLIEVGIKYDDIVLSDNGNILKM